MEIHDPDKMDKAKLEDVLVELLYGAFPDLTFHGGTAIWRCYGGNRFSRDIDLYYDIGKDDREKSRKGFSKFLKDSGFVMKSSSYNRDTDTAQFLVESNKKMKIDINFRYKRGTQTEYVRVDGSKMIVLALKPIELLEEKIMAYNDKLDNKSKFKQPEVQDLYDIYHLTTGTIKEKPPETKKRLKKLLERIRDDPPPDLRGLGSLIISGVPPTFEFMLKSISEWIS